MTTQSKVLITILVIVIAFAAGRWSLPAKIEKVIETKIVEVVKVVKDEKSSTDLQKNRRKETTTTETTYPDGRKVVETKVVETTETDLKKDKDSTTTTEKEKEKNSSSTEVVSYAKPQWHLSALAGLRLDEIEKGPVYGASVTKQTLGPISTGVWGLSSGVGGISIGLSF